MTFYQLDKVVEVVIAFYQRVYEIMNTSWGDILINLGIGDFPIGVGWEDIWGDIPVLGTVLVNFANTTLFSSLITLVGLAVILHLVKMFLDAIPLL